MTVQPDEAIKCDGEENLRTALRSSYAPSITSTRSHNFGDGWAHLASDDPAQMLAGASQRLFHDTATGDWHLVIEATAFVTHATLNVWSGTKHGGNDPVGVYTRISGCDPAAVLTIEVNL